MSARCAMFRAWVPLEGDVMPRAPRPLPDARGLRERR